MLRLSVAESLNVYCDFHAEHSGSMSPDLSESLSESLSLLTSPQIEIKCAIGCILYSFSILNMEAPLR